MSTNDRLVADICDEFIDKALSCARFFILTGILKIQGEIETVLPEEDDRKRLRTRVTVYQDPSMPKSK